MSKARPIIFDAESVNAILSGRKWQTRRVATGTALELLESGFTPECVALPDNKCSRYGYPGDLLYVKEEWAIVPQTAYRRSDGVHQTNHPDNGHDAAVYRAGWVRSPPSLWRRARFMPRVYSRLTLRLTDVRVERLQEITVDDVIAEGLTVPTQHVAAYMVRWNGINGKRAPSTSNPWVWVLNFERVTT